MEIINEGIQIDSKVLQEAIENQTIYHNDLTCEHWFFDFKLSDLWVESIEISNCLSKFIVNVYSTN